MLHPLMFSLHHMYVLYTHMHVSRVYKYVQYEMFNQSIQVILYYPQSHNAIDLSEYITQFQITPYCCHHDCEQLPRLSHSSKKLVRCRD